MCTDLLQPGFTDQTFSSALTLLAVKESHTGPHCTETKVLKLKEEKEVVIMVSVEIHILKCVYRYIYINQIIMIEICKVPTLQLRVLNKHNVHQDGECYPQFNKS